MPALYDRLLAEARRMPGVQVGSHGAERRATGSPRVSSFIVEGQPRSGRREDTAREEFVEAGLLRRPRHAGRSRARFSCPKDGAKGSRRDVVNEAMAKKFFGDVDPIGKRFGYDGTRR